MKLNNARKGFFEPEEFRLIGTHLSEPVDDIARFAYAVGWRSEEILGLRWEDIDLARRVIRIGESKNGDGRVVPISGALLDVIERRQGKRWPGSPWVFHRKGRRVVRFGVAWRKACKAAGLPHKLFHDFRRTACRDLIDAGYDPFTAMPITGHKSLRTFQRYKIVDTRRMAEALSGVDLYRRSALVKAVPGLETGVEHGQYADTARVSD